MSDQSWFDSNLFQMYVFKEVRKLLPRLVNSVWNSIKFLFPKFVGLINVYFLRKTNTFIKSKYSKNRQWSKSIVYFGLWFGVVSAFTFTYYNYRFLFILSYLWWFGAMIALTIVVSGAKKYWTGGLPNSFRLQGYNLM